MPSGNSVAAMVLQMLASLTGAGEWQGAAGAYRLQKTGWKLVETISGDWTTVVGVPLERIIERITR